MLFCLPHFCGDSPTSDSRASVSGWKRFIYEFLYFIQEHLSAIAEQITGSYPPTPAPTSPTSAPSPRSTLHHRGLAAPPLSAFSDFAGLSGSEDSGWDADEAYAHRRLSSGFVNNPGNDGQDWNRLLVPVSLALVVTYILLAVLFITGTTCWLDKSRRCLKSHYLIELSLLLQNNWYYAVSPSLLVSSNA